MPAPRTPRLGVLLSGGGRTLQNLLDRRAAGKFSADVTCVVGSRPDAYGLTRARAAAVPRYHEVEDARIFALLRAHACDLVVLAGWLRLLRIPPDFDGRVLNIHPALLPKFGGRGMHGDHVHAAVLAAGERESGCTVHLCNERYDDGRILRQQRVPVRPEDDVPALAARVFAAECEAYPAAIEDYLAELGGSGRGSSPTQR